MIESRKEQNQTGVLFSVYEWIDAIAVALVFVVVLFTFFLGIVGVSGESMMNTIHDGDKVIISNLFYTPQHGDIVIISRNTFNDPTDKAQTDDGDDTPIIKRVIGLPGDKIRLQDGSVYRNDVKLTETYTTSGTYPLDLDYSKDVTVPKGHILVMGDNRAHSLDSRSSQIGDKLDGYPGMVDERYVLGKAIYRVFPLSGFGGIYGNHAK